KFRVGIKSNISTNRNNLISGVDRCRSEERFSRNAETDLVCRLLLEKKKKDQGPHYSEMNDHGPRQCHMTIARSMTHNYRTRAHTLPTSSPALLRLPSRGLRVSRALSPSFLFSSFFFFNDTATTEIYTLSLHDALPI